MFVDRLVVSRIEQISIDTIDDTIQIIMTITQYDIEPVAKFRCLDLLCIGLGDRRDKVGIDNTDLHEVAGIVETQIAVLVVFIIKGQIIKQYLFVIFALISQVVDRQDVLDVSDRFDCIESDLAQSRKDRGGCNH